MSDRRRWNPQLKDRICSSPTFCSSRAPSGLTVATHMAESGPSLFRPLNQVLISSRDTLTNKPLTIVIWASFRPVRWTPSQFGRDDFSFRHNTTDREIRCLGVSACYHHTVSVVLAYHHIFSLSAYRHSLKPWEWNIQGGTCQGEKRRGLGNMVRDTKIGETEEIQTAQGSGHVREGLM